MTSCHVRSLTALCIVTTVSISSCLGFLSLRCRAEKNCEGDGYTHLLLLLLSLLSPLLEGSASRELEELDDKKRGMVDVSLSADRAALVFVEAPDIDTLFPGMNGCDAESALDDAFRPCSHFDRVE